MFPHYHTRDPGAVNRGSYYNQGTSSVSGSNGSEYTLGHQRTNSSTISSPYISPRGEYPNYALTTYQQQARDNRYQYPLQYPSNQYQPRQMPSLNQSGNYYGTLPSSVLSQPEPSRSYTTPAYFDQPRTFNGSYESHDPSTFDRGNMSNLPAPRRDFYSSQPQSVSASYERQAQSVPQTLPDPTSTFSSILPPLQSTVTSTQSRRDPPAYSYGELTNTEPQNLSQGSSSYQSGQEGQNYPSQYHVP